MPPAVSKDRKAFSVMIAGAGPVGLSIAALLNTAADMPPIELKIVESGKPKAWNDARTDLRVYALSRASQRLFEALGVWTEMLERRVSPYRGMQIWQGDHFETAAMLRFDCAEIGEPDLGHIVEDVLIRDRLTARLTNCDSTEIFYQTDVEDIEEESGRVRVGLSDGSSIQTDLLIAADGGASTVRERLNVSSLRRDYGQTAVVAHVEFESPHGEVARQRFLSGGPLALLPLRDGRNSIVWSLPTETAARYQALDDRDFIARLQTASGGVLGRVEAVSPRASFPLSMLHAARYSRPGVVLVGDAAHRVHPLAGQGMNLGLLDAAVLADELIRAARETGRLTGMRPLRRYERRRKGNNLQMMLSFDAIDRLFRLPAPLTRLPALGLSVADALPAAKRLFMSRALGLSQRLPAI